MALRYNLLQTLIDFLNFRIFISPYILLICYYLGAIGLPIMGWLFMLWIKRKFWVASKIYDKSKELSKEYIPLKIRISFFLLFLLFFISMEIVWRMMFEFLIAYLQMWDALMELSSPHSFFQNNRL